MKQKTYKILVSGQVQGVGFRPYVFGLATEFHLKGTVSNNIEGVVIFVTGTEKNTHDFYKKLVNVPPPVSRIKKSSIEQMSDVYFEDFQIIPSESNGQVNLPLTPDFAICDDCKKELENTQNRRHNYAFTTCVNCGPRWSVTEKFPFERAHTSIDHFSMCNTCSTEYTNPADRRFHSQTNTCSECGISFEYTDSKKNPVDSNSIFKSIAKKLSEGNIVAIKNTSGYLLCCNAEDTVVVAKLRRLKNRPKKPFAVLYPSLGSLERDVNLNTNEIQSLTSTERPITIISLDTYKGNIALESVAPGLNQLGVMLPYTGILQLLANQLDFAIVATSGNLHGSPIISNKKDALEKLQHVADYFLHHNLNITHPQDDSVLKMSKQYQIPTLFRRSRGYAPNYLDAEVKSEKKLLALGADLKNSIAFYPNEHMYVGQYIGNLENFDVYNRFTQEIEGFVEIFQQKPEVLLIDKHPNYQSTQYGLELLKRWNIKGEKIQHHKAHFAAALGEHKLFESNTVLGVVWDGTGYGDDGTIWGGEFFSYSENQIERIGHFENFNWLSGDKMSKEPRLSLFAILDEVNEAIQEKFSAEELQVLNVMKQRNKLKTSSVGRLFDAVASALGICDFNSYEGEAAILLENRVKHYDMTSCKNYCPEISGTIIPTKKLIEEVLNAKNKGVGIDEIIANFLFTLASVVHQIAKKREVTKICFSGGVFQNTTLIDMLQELNENKYELFFHRSLAPNDENIAFGQIMYYLNCKK